MSYTANATARRTAMFGTTLTPVDMGVSFYVDSESGSDSNTGRSISDPVATIGKALEQAEEGHAIKLHAGQSHAYNGSDITSLSRLGRYGDGDNPVIDARQSLAGKTWTLVSGTTWETTVEFRDETLGTATPDSVSNKTYYGLWDTSGDLIPRVWDDTAANNVAEVGSTSGSWCINRTGSSDDAGLESNPAGTEYTVTVNLSDGSDPNGKDIRIADIHKLVVQSVDIIDGVEIIGLNGKDSIGNDNTGEAILFKDCSHTDFGWHGWVGHASFQGVSVSGGARTMDSAYADKRTGSGLNIFAATDFSAQVLSMRDISVRDVSIAVYGHGSGNQGYKQLNLSGDISIENCNTALQFDPVPGTKLPFMRRIESTATLSITDVLTAFYVDGEWYFDGEDTSSITLGSLTSTSLIMNLVKFSGTSPYLRLANATIQDLTPHVAFSTKHYLVRRETDETHSTPTLELVNVVDLGRDTDNRFVLYRDGSVDQLGARVNLILSDGTTLGDIHDFSGKTNFPASLTVEAGCTFGMGNRTGPQIEAAMDGAGFAHSISHDTTIVGPTGTVLSSPGW